MASLTTLNVGQAESPLKYGVSRTVAMFVATPRKPLEPATVEIAEAANIGCERERRNAERRL
jgi:hypothetical protein